eukprot:CAMPEP_0194751898 /NCGR_PEP_ID=MMETSP0323_2-20130528/5812_1 /TAXON_ID=2866 ORGANISM="Crypthecodinium cohnii, Strain Seligo" /NCGR_SAMPLE_ID=MMETSP0323_2 /ASSEMBLY_ACC=CAM_ASM_000346 /LENGTH=138 /DNA_ID=CAMNT_0039668565 /DNA_START=472 /DNA_END=885 /DNA_ORIENTATION=+
MTENNGEGDRCRSAHILEYHELKALRSKDLDRQRLSHARTHARTHTRTHVRTHGGRHTRPHSLAVGAPNGQRGRAQLLLSEFGSWMGWRFDGKDAIGSPHPLQQIGALGQHGLGMLPLEFALTVEHEDIRRRVRPVDW